MNVAEFARFVLAQKNVITKDTRMGLFHSFARNTLKVVAVRATWLSPGGTIVVVSPSDIGAADITRSKSPENEITVTEFGQFLDDGIQHGLITGETPIGVFEGITNGVLNIARAKDAWVPPDGSAVVVSRFVNRDILEWYGFDKPENN